MTDCANPPQTQPDEPSVAVTPLPVARGVIGGLLMGMANLVPGISGGTMILVMGLYDEFVTSIADIVRLKLSRRNLAFMALIVASAGMSIAALAGTLSRAVTLHPTAMFSLFIGLTLGGVPVLTRMLKRASWSAVIGAMLGFALMLLMAMTRDEAPNRDAIRAAVAAGEFVVQPAYARDVAAGVLGLSAMILPGVSGAYMLLILDRYEPILAAVALAKRYVFSLGHDGHALVFLRVLVPTALGAVLSLVLFSNLLKWLLHRHQQPALGALLGILLGSVIGMWPFTAVSTGSDYTVGTALAVAGFLLTLGVSRVSA